MRIKEVSQRFSISPDTLRYYEREGLLGKVPRSESGIRDYTEANCQAIDFVLCMRSAGVSIEALSEYMKLLFMDEDTTDQRKVILEQQKRVIADRIADLQLALDRLTYKIDHYEEMILACEPKLRTTDEI